MASLAYICLLGGLVLSTAPAASASPGFADHALVYALVPQCKPHEGLCPISRGSSELHCVDFTAPETCGGCVTDGVGLNCEASSFTFMNTCTKRGQCTGCRWERGGLNQSLTEPDYLHCSITKSAPMKHLKRHAQREPVLSYQRVLQDLKVRNAPLAAHIRQDGYAGEDSVKPAPARRRTDGEKEPTGPEKRDKPKRAEALDFRDPSTLPDPPTWLSTYLKTHISSFPATTDDEELLHWLRRFRVPIMHASDAQTQAIVERSRSRTNADRFKNALPPLPPKQLNLKLSPAKQRAIDETKEEPNHIFWASILKSSVATDRYAAELRGEMLDALWELIGRVVGLVEVKQPKDMPAAFRKTQQGVDKAREAVLRKNIKTRKELEAEPMTYLPRLKIETLPAPPGPLRTLLAQSLSSVPLSTSDEPLVNWIRSLAGSISQARWLYAVSMEDVEEEAPVFDGIALQDNVLRYEDNLDVFGRPLRQKEQKKDKEADIWFKILREITANKVPVKHIRSDVVDALWELVARVAASSRAAQRDLLAK